MKRLLDFGGTCAALVSLPVLFILGLGFGLILKCVGATIVRWLDEEEASARRAEGRR